MSEKKTNENKLLKKKYIFFFKIIWKNASHLTQESRFYFESPTASPLNYYVILSCFVNKIKYKFRHRCHMHHLQYLLETFSCSNNNKTCIM